MKAHISNISFNILAGVFLLASCHVASAAPKAGLADLSFAEAKEKFPECFVGNSVTEIKFRDLDGYVMCGFAEQVFKDDRIPNLAKEAASNALLAFQAHIKKNSRKAVASITMRRRVILYQWKKEKNIYVNFYVSKKDVNVRIVEASTIVPKDAKLEKVWNEGEFTEGPATSPQGVIYFSDIGNRIMRFDPRSGRSRVFRSNSGKANGMIFNRNGRLIVCEGANGGNRRISVTDLNGKVHTFADRWEGKRFNSPNDLALDAKGRIYFTDPRYAGDEPREIDFEGVFLIERDGAVKLATKDVQKPNGILVSHDGHYVYVADNNSDPKGNHHLVRFIVQKDGALANKEVLFDFGPDRRGIDGMTLDVKGNIYATAGKGERAGVYVFTPAGKQLAFFPTPGTPTNCVFGAGKEKSTLYITAQAAAQANGSKPWGLFRIRLKIAGHHPFE